MRHFSPFRIAAYLLALFCVLHTVGGMIAQQSFGAEADTVFALMKTVSFSFNGATCTWYGFWFGFGMTASIFLLLSAVIAWQLDAVPPAAWRAVAPIAWALVAAHAANAALSSLYFFAAPVVFGIVVVVLLAVGAARKSRSSVGNEG